MFFVTAFFNSSVAFHFLRCNTAGKDEEDYRPLFENFLQDLLVTLNKNDWPASEALLTLLGRLLVRKTTIHGHFEIE